MGARLAAVVLCMVGAVGATEPDGAVAGASRWTGPDGPASHSRRSAAMPVVRDVVEAWALPLKGDASAPPVTWDGTAYVLYARGSGQELAGVDLATGKLLGTKMFPAAPAAAIHVWDGIVYVATTPSTLSGMRLVSAAWVEKHRFPELSFFQHGIAVIENEIYAVSSARDLVKLLPGRTKPVWIGPKCHGTPAVFGDDVIVLGDEPAGGPKYVGGGVFLRTVRRSDGTCDSGVFVSTGTRASGLGAHVTVGSTQILAHPPEGIPMEGGPRATHAFVPYFLDPQGTAVRIGEPKGYWSFRVRPAAYKDGFLACEGADEWQWWNAEGGRTLAKREFSPDLFTDLVPATVLGGVAYFGTWAADVDTREVLWRLPLRAVRFGVVPADRLLLVVDTANVLRAYRARVGR